MIPLIIKIIPIKILITLIIQVGFIRIEIPTPIITKLITKLNISDTLSSFNTIVSSYIEIKGNETVTYTLKFESSEKFRYSLELNVEVESNSANSFAESILKNNMQMKKTISEGRLRKFYEVYSRSNARCTTYASISFI